MVDGLVAHVADRLGRCLLAIRLHLDLDHVLQRVRLAIASEAHALVLEQLPSKDHSKQGSLHPDDVAQRVVFLLHHYGREVDDLLVRQVVDAIVHKACGSYSFS